MARLAALVVGLLLAGCTASDAATPSSVPTQDTELESDDEVFSEGQTETVAGDAGADADENDASDDDAGDDGGVASTSDASDARVEPDATAPPTVSEDDGTEPVGDGAVDTGGTNDPANGAGDIADADPAELDDIDDLIGIGDVDDVAFCQSYARIFEAFLGISFAGAFGESDSEDPDALVSLAETYEVLVYPGLSSDVQTIRDEDVDDLERFFAPLFERIDAVPGLLRDAGLSDTEISELTTGIRPSDLEAVEIDDLDPRVTDAAVALGRDFGPFFDAADALATPPSDADVEAFETELSALCPVLNESFGVG